MHTDNSYEHALLDIRRKLHDPRGSKAAVIVGAGFSKNAISRRTNGRSLPLWNDITSGLAERLYPDTSARALVISRAGATSSAMRLAQEFETAFGRTALVEFLRTLIRDDDFKPGNLHSDLLELPWADVFTTNYDRLLESASLALWKQHYELVCHPNDLPLARRPRIIKLHGSLPDLTNLVLTEEDYRTYPKKFAPYVAVVQAALTENVLCLIGFSGDDPNFLAWTGWLRDELQGAVPKTYFFTGDELQPFQRQLLESRHVVPIPIKKVSKCAEYEAAFKWLFNILGNEPDGPASVWNSVPQYVATREDNTITPEPLSPDTVDWVDTAIMWRTHRLQYRGWCVLHRDGAQQLQTYTDLWLGALSTKFASELPEATVLFILSEVVWRNSTALLPLNDDFVFSIVDKQLARFKSWRSTSSTDSYLITGKDKTLRITISELDSAYYLLLKECLRHAREIGDGDRFNFFYKELDEAFPQPDTNHFDDNHSFLRYQKALHALSGLHQSEARALLQSWSTGASDLIWSVRRAGLCLECGLNELGIRLLESTLTTVRATPISASLDIHAMSIEGITLSLLWATRSFDRLGIKPPELKSKSDTGEPDEKSTPSGKVLLERLTELGVFGCDPNEWLEWLEIATAAEPRRTKGTLEREGFDIGTVGSTIAFGGEPQLQLAYRAMRFIEDAGLPLRIPNVVSTTVASKLFKSAAGTIAYFSPAESVGLVIRSRDEKLVETVLTRECLVTLVDSQISRLFVSAIDALHEAIAHFADAPPTREKENEFWENQFRFACAILSRVVVRLNDEQVANLFRELISLPHNSKVRDRFQCNNILATCIRRTASSVASGKIPELLLDILAVPSPGGPELPQTSNWFDPIGAIGMGSDELRAAGSPEVTEHIDAMLARLNTARGIAREYVFNRLAILTSAQLLSTDQKEVFAHTLYSHCDEYGLPADTGYLDTFILRLPAVPSANETKLFRCKYLSTTQPTARTWQELSQTSSVISELQGSMRRAIPWTSDDIDVLLSMASAWLGQTKRCETDTSSIHASKSHWFAAVGFEDDEERFRKSLPHWLAALEVLVLLNSVAHDDHKQLANELIGRVESLGYCVTQSSAARACLGYIELKDATSDIKDKFTARNLESVKQACAATIRWCQLRERRGTDFPEEIQHTLVTLISSRRDDALPIWLSTVTSILEYLEQAEKTSLIKAMDSKLVAILAETDYNKISQNDTFSFGKALSIRVACARFARTAQRLGLQSPAVDRWIESVRQDTFADIRRKI